MSLIRVQNVSVWVMTQLWTDLSKPVVKHCQHAVRRSSVGLFSLSQLCPSWLFLINRLSLRGPILFVAKVTSRLLYLMAETSSQMVAACSAEKSPSLLCQHRCLTAWRSTLALSGCWAVWSLELISDKYSLSKSCFCAAILCGCAVLWFVSVF